MWDRSKQTIFVVYGIFEIIDLHLGSDVIKNKNAHNLIIKSKERERDFYIFNIFPLSF